MKVAVLGGGNGGFASAADLTRRGFSVALFTFDSARAADLRENGNLLGYDGVWGQGSCRLECVTDDMAEAVSGAELVVMNVPGTGHEKYLAALRGCLAPETVLYMNPGHTGGALRAAGILGRGGVAEANTLSYIARKSGPRSVYVSSSDKSVSVGVFPARRTEEVTAVIRRVYPAIVPARDVLESSLSNINMILHPAGVILNAGWIERTGGNFAFYYEGITPAIARVMSRLDGERLAVARAFRLALEDFGTCFYRAGSTSKEAAESRDMYRVCQESEPNKFIRAPESLEHRYMHEDIGSGLLPLSELGRLTGTATPVADALICAAEAMMQRDYREEGVNLRKMRLTGLSPEEAVTFVREG